MEEERKLAEATKAENLAKLKIRESARRKPKKAGLAEEFMSTALSDQENKKKKVMRKKQQDLTKSEAEAKKSEEEEVLKQRLRKEKIEREAEEAAAKLASEQEAKREAKRKEDVEKANSANSWGVGRREDSDDGSRASDARRRDRILEDAKRREASVYLALQTRQRSSTTDNAVRGGPVSTEDCFLRYVTRNQSTAFTFFCDNRTEQTCKLEVRLS